MAEQRDQVNGRLDAGDPRTLGGFRLLTAEDGADGIRHYLARSPHDARTVAVTAVRPDRAGNAALRARLSREETAARAAAGPWVVPLVDADPDAAVPWLAYAYVPVLPLTEVVREHGPFAGRAVRALGSALAEALGALHDAGWTHGGLTPDAVSLAADGPRLGGLGEARTAAEGRAAAEGEAADVRALAAVLVFAATGRTDGDVAQVPPPLRDVLRPALDGGTGRHAPRLAKLRTALDAPTPGSGPLLALPGQAVARLAARAAEALALESADGVPAGRDEATRQLRTGEVSGEGPPPGSGATLQLRSGADALEQGTGAVADAPEGAGRTAGTDTAATAATANAADPRELSLEWPAAAPGDGQRSGLEPLPDLTPLPEQRPGPGQPSGPPPPPAVRDDGPGSLSATTTEAARLRSGPDQTHGQAHGQDSGPRSRRALLLAGAAGAAGLVVGGGAVAGWVTGRGGGLDALTRPDAPGAGYGPPGADSGRKPPRGTPPTALWRYDLPGGNSVKNAPLIWRDKIAILVGTDSAVGVDLRTGETVWSRNDLASVSAPQVISEELGLVMDGSELVAFEARSGQRRWGDEAFTAGTPKFNGRSADQLRAATGDGRVAFVTAQLVGGDDTEDDEARHTLSAYDTRERRERWHVPLSARETEYGLSVHATRTSVITMAPRAGEPPEVTSYRLTDGKREWRRTPTGLTGKSVLSLAASLGTVFASRGGDLRAIGLDSGAERWSRQLVSDPGSDLGPAVLRPAPPPGQGEQPGNTGKPGETGKPARRLYLADGNRSVLAVAPEDGREIWRTHLSDDSVWRATPVLETSTSGRTVLAASNSGVMAIDARSGGLLWRFRETRGDSMDDYKVYSADGVVLVTHATSAFALPVD